MAGKLRVTVDHNICVGNAMCPNIAEKVFAINEKRQSEVIDSDGEPREVVLEAAEACPVGAIIVIDADTEDQLFP